VLGMREWRRLESELRGGVKVQYGGSAGWFPEGKEADEVAAAVEAHQKGGYAARRIGLDKLRHLVAAASPGDFAIVYWCDDEATVDPVEALTALLAAAVEQGAKLHSPCKVIGFSVQGGRAHAITTDQGMIEGAAFVLACGTGSPALAAAMGIRVPLK